MVDVEKATKDFEQKLKSGYFSSMRQEAHDLAVMSEPEEDYKTYKLQRDTEAVKKFAESGEFLDILKDL